MPVKAMQFGWALPRLLHSLPLPSQFGLLLMMKIDLVGGYYHVLLSSSGIPHLGVILPADLTG